MRAFIAALIATAAISAAANFYLTNEAGFSSAEQTTGPAVRLD